MERIQSVPEERAFMPEPREQQLDEKVAEIIQNKDIDISGRIELAKQYVEEGFTVRVPVMTLLTMDGMTTNEGMSSEEFAEFRKQYRFDSNTYTGNEYDARTPSQTDGSLTLRVTEKGIHLPGPSELFPGGFTHSIWDHQVDVDVLVTGNLRNTKSD